MNNFCHKAFSRSGIARRAGLVLFASLTVAGCTSAIKGRADPPSYLQNNTFESVYIEDIENALADAKRAEAAYCKFALSACEVAEPSTLAVVNNAVAADTAKMHRNDYLYAMTRAYKLALEDYARSLSIEGGRGTFLAKMAELGLTAAAGISKVEETSRVLNALALAAVGIDEQYDKELLLGQTISALVNKMRAAQARGIATLLKRVNDPINAYPLTAAKADLVNLGAAATIETAVADLTAEAEKDRKKAEKLEQCVREDASRKAATNGAGTTGDGCPETEDDS